MTLPFKQCLAVVACLISIPVIAFIALLAPYLAPQIHDSSMSYFFGSCPTEHTETHTRLRLNGQSLEIPTELVQDCILYGRRAFDDERHIFLYGRLSDYVVHDFGQTEGSVDKNQRPRIENPKVTMEIQPTNARQAGSLANFRFQCQTQAKQKQQCTTYNFQFSRSNSATIDIYLEYYDNIEDYSKLLFEFLSNIQ